MFRDLVKVRAVNQRLGLGCDRLGDGWMAMAKTTRGNTRAEIKVADPFVIPQLGANSPNSSERKISIGRKNIGHAGEARLRGRRFKIEVWRLKG